MKDVYIGNNSYYLNSDMKQTYNLMDSSRLKQNLISGYVRFEDDYYIPVIAGKAVMCNRYKGKYLFYDANKVQISSEYYVDTYTPVVVPSGAEYMQMSYNGLFTAYGDDILIYYSENDVSPRDDQRDFVPNKLVDGKIINSGIYDDTCPEADNSEFMNRVKYSAFRDIRKAENVIRIGCFNIFISRQFGHWHVIKKELKDHAVDICGFEEVRYGETVGTVERRLPEFLKSWQFPYGSYHDPQVQPSSNKALASHWEVLSTTEYVYPSNADGSFIKCVIKLPHYRDSRDGVNEGEIDLTLSMYVYHATSSKGVSVRLSEIADILNVIASDTSDFKLIVGDANAFEAGVVDGRTQEWDAWKAGGFTPIYETRNINTVNSKFSILPYDNIFMGANITCKYFNVVPSSDYLVNIRGSIVPVSDHDLLYADLVFDFQAVIDAKIEQAKSDET